MYRMVYLFVKCYSHYKSVMELRSKFLFCW